MPDVKWFDPRKMLSYNCLFNFCVGVRGGGKTFNSKRFGVERFKKTGEQFIYLRRYEREVDDAKKGFFDGLKKEGYFEQDDLKVKGSTMYCNDKIMGYILALSTSLKKKSKELPYVRTIIFDEFMVDGVTTRYIGRGDYEVELFNNFYETVDRLRDETRVIFISNSFSIANIYFNYFSVTNLNHNKIYNRINDNLMVCLWKDATYTKAKQNTRFYKLVNKTNFSKHAYENEFILDNKEFISKKSKTSEHHFNFEFMKQLYAVYVDWNQGKYYVTKKGVNTAGNKTISLTLADNKLNNINIRRVRQMPFMLAFKQAIEENNVLYDDLNTWHNLHEVLYLLQTVK